MTGKTKSYIQKLIERLPVDFQEATEKIQEEIVPVALTGDPEDLLICLQLIASRTEASEDRIFRLIKDILRKAGIYSQNIALDLMLSRRKHCGW